MPSGGYHREDCPVMRPLRAMVARLRLFLAEVPVSEQGNAGALVHVPANVARAWCDELEAAIVPAHAWRDPKLLRKDQFLAWYALGRIGEKFPDWARAFVERWCETGELPSGGTGDVRRFGAELVALHEAIQKGAEQYEKILRDMLAKRGQA